MLPIITFQVEKLSAEKKELESLNEFVKNDASKSRDISRLQKEEIERLEKRIVELETNVQGKCLRLEKLERDVSEAHDRLGEADLEKEMLKQRGREKDKALNKEVARVDELQAKLAEKDADISQQKLEVKSLQLEKKHLTQQCSQGSSSSSIGEVANLVAKMRDMEMELDKERSRNMAVMEQFQREKAAWANR